MIERRPTRLKEYWDQVTIPPVPFSLSWEWAPELVRISLGTLHGVQPVTRTMFEIAGGMLLTKPTEAEVDYFRHKQTRFQMIHLVMSLAWWQETRGVVSAVPFAISALPATKRGVLSSVDIDYVDSLRGAPIRPEADFVYSGFDPFRGDWSLAWHGSGYIAENRGKVLLDEVGIAIERYFLALDFDPEEVVEFDCFLADEKSRRGYLRNRIRKLFTPFVRPECRRIWGVDSPEELFLLQELLFRGLRPEFQYLVYPNGTCYPSLYDVYADIEFRRGMEILTEIDFFFPQAGLAVFCDGAHHQRSKNIKKDEAIGERLADLGIRSIRLPNRLINENLKVAGDQVVEALNDATGMRADGSRTGHP